MYLVYVLFSCSFGFFGRKILREIKVQLGKSDAEMQTDPLLSLSNLMRFDPDAEDGEFDLVAQEVSVLVELKSPSLLLYCKHEMVVSMCHRNGY